MSYGNGINAPFGLKPSTYFGSSWNGTTSEYFITSGYGTSLFNGDPVTLLADGSIGIGAANVTSIGVFNGVKYTDAFGNFIFSPFWPANTVTQQGLAATALVIDDPSVLFDIQTNGNGIVLANLNANANFVPGTGSTITGQSGFALSQGSIGAGAIANLKILHFTPVPGNVSGIPFNNVIVAINNHFLKGGTGTAGV